MHSATHQAIATVWRMESAKIIAKLTRMVRDIGVAEELAQDALVAALERWPLDGLPDNPAAWLMTTAKNRALDRIRHQKMQAKKLEEIGHNLEAREALLVPDFVDALDDARQDDIGDDLLRLIFTACHPVLSAEARVALTLKLLGGLSTHEIARAFLVPEATIAQRIVRAKRALSDTGVLFEVPRGDALDERLASVLEVVYLIFNEGYTATAGEDWMRPVLIQEALRLGRMLAELAPVEPEAHGLVALMELQASRVAARLDAAGKPGAADDPGPGPLGHLADSPRAGCAGACTGASAEARVAAGVVHAAGSHRGLSCACGTGARHRLACHCSDLRNACPGNAFTGGGIEPGRCGGNGFWAGSRAGDC